LGVALLAAISAAEERPYQELPYTPSLDVSAMDRAVDPCEDLYAYACGGWQQHNPIPADQSSWAVYGKLYVDNQRFLWGILEDAARPDPKRTPTQQKIGDHFAACMDESAIERAGITPLQPDLERIERLKTKQDLALLVGDLHARATNGNMLFGSGAEQDARDASTMIAALYAGGLGLPDRDYYVKDDPKFVENREHYVAHIASLFELLGTTPPTALKQAKVVLRIETQLAKASLTRVEMRDPYKIYHRETLDSLRKMAPAFAWDRYFEATHLAPTPWLNVAEPAFVTELNARLQNETLTDLKSYLRWTLLAATAPYLSKAFVDEDFAFNRAYLRGVKEQKPRWKRCVGLVDAQLGEALGQEFVARVFPPAMKSQTVLMTHQIEAAMKTRIEALDWMSPSTKAQALSKLAAVRDKVGFPDVWRDYSALRVERGDFFGNAIRGAEFDWLRQAAKIGRPVDRAEWFMTPPTVNAYYNPSMNDINFPAGVLLPPLYDPKMDDAPNYGNTGGTIGHELTHGFDDSGRQYDGAGNLRDWWTPDDAQNFEQRAQCIRNQYSQYIIVDDIKINGPLTSGEDIADLGGELLAWMAWQGQTKARKLAEQDGLTPEQRFFVGFAQWACSNQTPEQLRLNAVTNPHSPPRYRINGVVSNMPQFVEAFQCKAGKALVRPEKELCKVW
jgi:endothelin-converting enzyme/putative endopeptidase